MLEPRPQDLAADQPEHCRRYRIRRIDPQDRQAIEDFHKALSPEARERRFLGGAVNLRAHAARLVAADDPTLDGVVALAGSRFIGVAELARIGGTGTEAEIAVAVADDWRREAVATLLVARLRERATRAGIATLRATIAANNRPAIELVRSLEPDARLYLSGTIVTAEIPTPSGSTSRRPRDALARG